MNLEAAIGDQVRRAVRSPFLKISTVEKLKGEASNRSYYRVRHGGPTESSIVMVMPKDARSEEATKGETPAELPFVNVHRYLSALNVRVPKILHFDELAGMMVLEDLGDITFELALESGKNNQVFYARAVDNLARLRAASEKKRDPQCIAFQRAFDEDLYNWELHHFREWGLEIWSEQKPSISQREELNRWFRSISAELAAEPRGFTHRDYQSRNIMVKGDELIVIDFQDALQGPRQYDLVALLRDSYVELDLPFVESMLDRYLDAFKDAGGAKLEGDAFKSAFHLLTVQRKLKDAGRFEFIHRVKGNSGFLVSIPASLRYVRDAFSRCPQLSALQDLLSQFLPVLQKR